MTPNTQSATAPKRLPLGSFGWMLAFLARGYDRHLQRIDLSELTDDQLHDIGLSRRDVTREVAKPFWR
ncbi:hypothetical protein GGQ99_002678 [Aminobacter niigataensis]|uniref:YjiS-like domain-containing protein n=1 Tax=Aminobacter niigataensis TaxID=83265 RepID=A0ABR6L296_9HYPH|nr:DUF1127 domain-containing protein [Aminobacter niigataensis]MBB4650915.1 hypothetical protein [Aminobacter niigataensis]